MTRTWSDLIIEVEACACRVSGNRFVLLTYDTGFAHGPRPYAQAALDDDGWHCEVVSGHYLLPGLWPLDETWLKRSGWTLSHRGAANWFRPENSAESTARAMVNGLRFGRKCVDPGAFEADVESFVLAPEPPTGGGLNLAAPEPAAWSAA